MAEENLTSNDETTEFGKTLASWEFPEFVNQKRTTGWLILASLVIVGLLLFSIFTANYLFLIIILIVIVIYIIRIRRVAEILAIEITEDGVAIGEKTFYEWGSINNFWIIYNPPEVKNLYFDFKSGLRPSIAISLENQNPLKIRKILAEYIDEDIEKENEPLSDGLSRIMKL